MTSQGSRDLEMFLHARSEDDRQHEWDEYVADVTGGEPVSPEFELRLRRTMRATNIDVRAASRKLAISMGAAARLYGWLKQQAARYSDHPDYRQEWRP